MIEFRLANAAQVTELLRFSHKRSNRGQESTSNDEA